jgi:uncharacterized protein (TIGR02646 family)
MIRVRKPAYAPASLRDRGVTMTAELCDRVDAGEPVCFDHRSRAVYGAADVKQALRTAQHDKCCFCEAKLSHSQFGDVEHFRPKASARQHPDHPPTNGYYWLAFEWQNLYLSCEVCNRRHKHELFPLAHPEQRVLSHHRSAELHAEQPMFVDPGHEDPASFIEFRREYAAAVAGNARGFATCDALQLNRPSLVENRRECRQALLGCMTSLAIATQVENLSEDIYPAVIDALNAVVHAISDLGQYSAMSRAVVRHVVPWRPHWVPPAESLFEELRADVARGLRFNLGELSHVPL